MKAKSHQRIADEYGISVRTLNRWIKRKELDIPRGLIDPFHQEQIYKAFGTPQDQKTVGRV
jgi:hypothetical protein